MDERPRAAARVTLAAAASAADDGPGRPRVVGVGAPGTSASRTRRFCRGVGGRGRGEADEGGGRGGGGGARRVTTGIGLFADCRKQSAKAEKRSAKALPTVFRLGSRQRGAGREDVGKEFFSDCLPDSSR